MTAEERFNSMSFAERCSYVFAISEKVAKLIAWDHKERKGAPRYPIAEDSGIRVFQREILPSVFREVANCFEEELLPILIEDNGVDPLRYSIVCRFCPIIYEKLKG